MSRRKGHHTHYFSEQLDFVPVGISEQTNQKRSNGSNDYRELLNFKFDPLPQATKHATTKRFLTKKGRFLQSNHKFVVSPKELQSYISQGCPSDYEIKWDNIYKVFYHTDKDLTCPICLGEPICPIIVECGHIYCFSCMLQYFSYSEKLVSTCPVCQIVILKKSFKPVEIIKQTSIPETVKLNLVKRSSKTNYLTNYQDELDIYAFNINSPSCPFNRIFYTSDIDLLFEQYETSLQMNLQNSIEEHSENSNFVLESIEQFEKSKTEMRTEVLDYRKLSRFLSNDADCSIYQDSNGRSLFSHPIMYNFLKKEYGDISNFPLVLEGEILDITSEFTQSEEVNRRYRFLSHLPTGCFFRFCLMDISHLLTGNNLKGFKKAITTYQDEKIVKQLQEEELEKEAERRANEARSLYNNQSYWYNVYSEVEDLEDNQENFPDLSDSITLVNNEASSIWSNSSAVRHTETINSSTEEFPSLSGLSSFPSLGDMKSRETKPSGLNQRNNRGKKNQKNNQNQRKKKGTKTVLMSW
eukprot:TRINITY_DN12174_c0_g1_i1.p1 TRINITY_DN12174_c0_g1~~TRINITY_DN12174_c0_g1_i1.p1  ORF type:complete len:525 (+),score=97.46 TRINITY_DN12174_c0_g1_i1:57-1631(+)